MIARAGSRFAAAVASVLIVLASGVGAWAAEPVTVAPGSVVRWQGSGTESCAAYGRTWSPLGPTCWFPVDLLGEGELILTRVRDGRQEQAHVQVGAYPYPVQELQVAERMVKPDEENLPRIEREAREVAALWTRAGPARYSLPLGRPLASASAGRSFGARRVLNGEPRSPHSGVDLKAARGEEVLTVADGVVALADSHYFAGNSVFVDHGGGLISMYFHLDTIAVAEGQSVGRGETLGTVGATGRATGPHLHFGLRWHGARIDPALLLGPVEDVPTIRE